MRVISQDGTIDMPYEEVLITLGCSGDKREYHINGHLIHPEGSSSVKLATYFTEEKAKKAMEMLHNDYYDHVAEKTYQEGAYYIHPYFRFPKDEDVEV